MKALGLNCLLRLKKYKLYWETIGKVADNILYHRLKTDVFTELRDIGERFVQIASGASAPDPFRSGMAITPYIPSKRGSVHSMSLKGN